MSTQVAILAGGLGTRLRPITEKIPKPMVEVAGKPFLHWQLLDLKSQGYTRVLLLVAYLGEQVRDYFGSGEKFGMQIDYVFEPEPLGTGGALRNALDKLDDEFILLNGDSFLHAPLRVFEKFARQFEATVSTYAEFQKVPVIPNLKIDDFNGFVIDYQKDAGVARGFDHIDSGIYFLKRRLLEGIEVDRFALADLWPALIEQKAFGAFPVKERFYDIGTPERLKEFEEKVRDYFPNTVSN